MRDSSRLKIVHSENTKKESFIKEVKAPEPVEELEIGDFDDEELEIEEIEEIEETEIETFEIDEEQKETLIQRKRASRLTQRHLQCACRG